jgi:hypothetical protein
MVMDPCVLLRPLGRAGKVKDMSGSSLRRAAACSINTNATGVSVITSSKHGPLSSDMLIQGCLLDVIVFVVGGL